MKRKSSFMIALTLTSFSLHAAASDLLQAWHAAQNHDPEFTAARAEYEAGNSKRDQGSALWRPSVSLSATAGRMTNDTSTTGAQFSAPGFGQSSGVNFDTSVRNGNLTRYTINAKQPLINRDLLAQSRQLSLGADVADAQWQNAQQDLMMRVAQRYFDVVIASETLRMLKLQQTAVEHARNEAQDRFKLGSVPVTDTHEAAARAETIKAQVMAAQMDLNLKQAAFTDLTGSEPHDLATLKQSSDGSTSSLPPLDNWLAQASLHNPMLAMQKKNESIAHEEVARHSALASPSLDLVAQAGRDRLNGSGDFGSAENNTTNRMISIQLNIPIFTGGYRSAKESEALRLADKSRADGEHLSQQIAQQTRSAWLGITVGSARITALEQANTASQSRLASTQLGHSVGDRTTLDLLNAENDAMSSELALLQARVAVALDRLRLSALAGTLDENTLQTVNGMLQGSTAH
jgi:outer membrane protein